MRLIPVVAALLGLVACALAYTPVSLNLICGMNENVTAAPFDYGNAAFFSKIGLSQADYNALEAQALEFHANEYGISYGSAYPGGFRASTNYLWNLSPLVATGDYHCSTVDDKEGELRGDFDESNQPVFQLGEFVASINNATYNALCVPNGCNYNGRFKGKIERDHIVAFGLYKVLQVKQGRPIRPEEDPSKFNNITETMTMESLVPGTKAQDPDTRQSILTEHFVMRSASRGVGIAVLQIAIGTVPNTEGKIKVYLHNNVQFPAPRGIARIRF